MMKLTTLSSVLALFGSIAASEFIPPQNALGETFHSNLSATSSEQTEEVFADSQLGVLTTPEGKVVGAIVDFIFDLKANRILYAAGVFQEPEKFKDRVLVFPWNIVHVNLDLNAFVLNSQEISLASAPSFSAQAWLDLPSAQWKKAIVAVGKEKRSAHLKGIPASAQVLSRASDLIGKKVETLKGKTIGALAELLVDPERGSIAYAIISFDDSGTNSHLLFYSLPWTTVQADPVQLTFVVPDFVEEEVRHPTFLSPDDESALEVFVSPQKNNRLSQTLEGESEQRQCLS